MLTQYVPQIDHRLAGRKIKKEGKSIKEIGIKRKEKTQEG